MSLGRLKYSNFAARGWPSDVESEVEGQPDKPLKGPRSG